MELEGSRFGSSPRDLANSFKRGTGQNIVLNGRLPGITRRDVLSSDRG
jgi:hypothetical protein